MCCFSHILILAWFIYVCSLIGVLLLHYFWNGNTLFIIHFFMWQLLAVLLAFLTFLIVTWIMCIRASYCVLTYVILYDVTGLYYDVANKAESESVYMYIFKKHHQLLKYYASLSEKLLLSRCFYSWDLLWYSEKRLYSGKMKIKLTGPTWKTISVQTARRVADVDLWGLLLVTLEPYWGQRSDLSWVPHMLQRGDRVVPGIIL